MCVIFQLAPGYTLPLIMLQNAVHNNPHGYGIIIKRNGALTVVRELPEAGNDPEPIYKILKDNEDAERFVHVRFKTAGAISLDNTQPFQVYNDRGREIWFSHNGTLSQFTPSYAHGVNQEDAPMSDSRKYATDVLMKYLPKFIGDNGIGDYHDPVMSEIMEKFWSVGSKGLLVSNDMDPYFLGLKSWEMIPTTELIDGEEVKGSFFASNNDYFERLKRGPLFERLEAERRKKEEEERQAQRAKVSAFTSQDNREIIPLSCPVFSERFSLSETLVDILEDYDLYKADGYVQLANVSYAEWLSLLSKFQDEDTAGLMLYLTDFLKTNTNQLTGLIDDLAKVRLENEDLAKVIDGYKMKEKKVA